MGLLRSRWYWCGLPSRCRGSRRLSAPETGGHDSDLPFSAPVSAWFEAAFAAPTPVQVRGWHEIALGHNALLLAPTGSGKTLAAFLWAVDRVANEGTGRTDSGVRVLYVSPLKALVYDIERNLRAPLIGIARQAERLGQPVRLPRVDVRTGDTPQAERRRQLREPGEILVTTPESLYLLLGSKAAQHLTGVHTVIVDEVHALAATKRGAHLALSLERLESLCGRAPQRIGLSATVRPPDVAARFLAGARPIATVDAATPPNLDLGVVVPVPEMHRIAELGNFSGGSLLAEMADPEAGKPPAERGIWSVVVPALLEEVRAARSSIVFVNSRGLAERLSQQLNDLADEELALAHHGSVSHEQRRAIEEGLKRGDIRCIVATSTMELGIDMGAVDRVLLVESPGSVARGLQRVGRAGHQVGSASIGRIYPKHRGDLLESMVVAERMRVAAIESIRIPENPLDVLAQQLVAMCCVQPMSRVEIAALVRRAAPFTGLGDASLDAVLEMLSGRYASLGKVELRPRLSWDRTTDTLSARRGTEMLVRTNVGTIPDRGLYAVHAGTDGPRVGELDEEMVFESRVGETFLLGASSWRIEQITRDRVIVSPAPGEPGKLPFWRGDGPGRSPELGHALGQMTRELAGVSRTKAVARLSDAGLAQAHAADNLLDYLEEQREATGALPTDRTVVVERFTDELGDWRICILSPFGARVHAPWAMALERRIGVRAGFEVQLMYADDGIVLRLPDLGELPALDDLFPDPEDIETLIVEQLADTAMYAGLFRESAARALLLPRRSPGARSPLWVQRMKSAELLAAVRESGDFPIALECYREALADQFDLEALRGVLLGIRQGRIQVHEAETPRASPFARSLVFAYVAAYLYEQDAPLAERKAQALSLDRDLLAELVGHGALRELIDPDVMHDVEMRLQHLNSERQARDIDDLELVLARLGDLSTAELEARAHDPTAVAAGLEALAAAGRIIGVRIGGEPRWLAIQDAALYRDALGVVPPAGLSEALLEPFRDPSGSDALSALAARFAAVRGPFTLSDLADRFALRPAQLEAPLALLTMEGRLTRGEIDPRRAGEQWCDVDVLRRLKRETLARLRNQVAPVPAPRMAEFLPAWQGVGTDERGLDRLLDVIAQLAGVALPWSLWREHVLPSRVSGFSEAELERACASGIVVWVGAGAAGPRDMRVAFYLREQVSDLLPEPDTDDDAAGSPRPADGADDADAAADAAVRHAVIEVLGTRGACFTTDLEHDLASIGEAGATERFRRVLDDLARAGVITNDTLGPLAGLAGDGRGRRRSAGGSAMRGFGRRVRSRAGASAMAAGGRWSLVRPFVAPEPTKPPASAPDRAGTSRLLAKAETLLARYGIVAREMAAGDGLAGGFQAVYPVLKQLEESGKVRRGYFLEGLSGAQFAMPGAVDMLRDFERQSLRRDGPELRVLPALDPANPYGSILPWPALDGRRQAARRQRAAWVVLCGTRLLAYYAAGSRALTVFDANDSQGALSAGLSALAGQLRGRNNKLMVIQTVNGEAARQAALAPLLIAAGFVSDYRGFTALAPARGRPAESS
ncbi:MAG: DEAD/DEAH box helicase [Pseudomonadota bacterium]